MDSGDDVANVKVMNYEAVCHAATSSPSRHNRCWLFLSVSAVAIFIAIRGYSSTDPAANFLSFYIVSDDKIPGGQFIDTLDLPKLGCISAKPDLVITQLVSVKETVSHQSMGSIDKNGKITETPLPDLAALEIQITPDDLPKMKALTGQNLGKRMLMMIGQEPLIAPTINAPISTPGFQVTIGVHGDLKSIENTLKRLVR